MKNGIVAFCGSKGSGKSTSAAIYKKLSNTPTEEIALAGHLKDMCAQVFGVEHNRFIDPALKEVELDEYVVLGPDNLGKLLLGFCVTNYDSDKIVRPHVGRVLRTPRALLQYIGTEVLHPVDPLIHVKMAVRNKDPDKLTLVTDLRFLAEFEYFRTVSGFVAAYVRNSAAELRASADGHPSERQFELFKTQCRLIDNEGSMGDLLVNVAKFETEVRDE